jgi:acyl-CoA synthetase (AMP-forming)/AMP-acid ligase II
MAIFRSPFPDVEAPNATLHDYVLAQAGARGDTLALIDGVSGRCLTYAQLDEMVRRLATGLATLGVRKGDVVALFSPNTIAYPVVFYAAARAGATITPVNALATPGELATQLADSNARYLVTVSGLLERAAAATEQRPVAEVVVCDVADGVRSIDDLMALGGEVPEVAWNCVEDVAVLPYSSGTTGAAKGVMLTGRNLVANLVQARPVLSIGEGQRLAAVLPFSHIYALTLMNHGLAAGATVVTLPRFDLEQFLKTLATYAITHAFVVPPIVLALAHHPLVDSYDLSQLQLVFSGGAPLDADLAQACAKRLGVPVTQGYGMTELSPVSHAVPAGQTAPPGSVGPLVPSTECRLVDPVTGADVGVGAVGELWIRGPQVMRAYLGRPEATAEVMSPEGWLRTGDIGRVDEDGNFSIVDRLKELIKYKGYQVAPAELEALLLGHPGIADAAVIGVRDADGEEIPQAFIVPAATTRPTADEVIDYVAQRVAPYKKVRRVEFIEAIPRSASGKVLRNELRARRQ